MAGVAMPRPSRVASGSIAMLQRLGLTREESVRIVLSVCQNVLETLDARGITDTTWIQGVYLCAAGIKVVTREGTTYLEVGK